MLSQSNDFAEDCLPEGQHVIQTPSVESFKAFCWTLTNNSIGSSRMGVVTGAPGTGKTTAIQDYLNSLNLNSHTGLPSAVGIKVKPKASQRALALDIVSALKDKARGRTSYELADEAAEIIMRNDLDMLFVDEGDRLKDDTFDLLRHLHDKTGVVIVVVGLDPILGVIDRQEKFKSRVALRLRFEQLETETILKIVLPELIIPFWQFDPSKPEDIETGKWLWTLVKPSLRRLRNVLAISSRLVDFAKEERISKDNITEAFRWNATDEERRSLAQPQMPRTPGSPEDISERRHAAKKRMQQR